MRAFVVLWLVVAGLGEAMAQGRATAWPAQLTDSQLAAAGRTENFSIPAPGEIFMALDAGVRPSWPQWVKFDPPPALEDRERIALYLGRLVTDGYVAVEAQDAQAVKNIGKDILSLAKKLNVSQSVLARAGSINDFAEANDWNALREELEATQNEVKLDMAEQKDDRLITLVTVGAWIRGIELASAMVAQQYSPEAANLLQQPAIAGFLVERLDSLPETTRTHPAVISAREALVAVGEIIVQNSLSEEGVRQVGETMHRALSVIAKQGAGKQ